MKKGSSCWPIYQAMEIVSKNFGKCWNDTYYCKLELKSWVNITVFYTRFLSPTDHKCAESSTFRQFFYYRPPVKFRYTAGEIVKMWCQELDIYCTYIYCIYIYIYIYIYHPLDNRYGFSISVPPEITPLFSFFNVLKCFSKVGRSVIGWRSG